MTVVTHFTLCRFTWLLHEQYNINAGWPLTIHSRKPFIVCLSPYGAKMLVVIQLSHHSVQTCKRAVFPSLSGGSARLLATSKEISLAHLSGVTGTRAIWELFQCNHNNLLA